MFLYISPWPHDLTFMKIGLKIQRNFVYLKLYLLISTAILLTWLKTLQLWMYVCILINSFYRKEQCFLISILIIILIESNKDFWSDLLLTIFKFQKDYKISIFLFAFLYENDELIFYEANIFVKLGRYHTKGKQTKLILQ